MLPEPGNGVGQKPGRGNALIVGPCKIAFRSAEMLGFTASYHLNHRLVFIQVFIKLNCGDGVRAGIFIRGCTNINNIAQMPAP